MGYPEAVQAMVQQRQVSGYTDVTVNALMLGRFADTLGTVESAGGFLRVNKKRINSSSDLYVLANLPGVRIREPLHMATSGVVPLSSLGPFAGRYSRSALSGHQDAASIEIGAQLDALWDKRIRSTGFFTSAQIDTARAAINAGLLPFPIKEKTYAALFPSLPLELYGPVMDNAADRAKWDAICEQFLTVIKAYDQKNMVEAAAQLAAAESWAGWADLAYRTTEAIATPYTLAKGLVDTIGLPGLVYMGLAGVALFALFPVVRPLLKHLGKG